MTGWVTRRAFLAAATGAAAAVGTGAAYSLSPSAPAEGMRALGDTEARIVAALADAFFPGVHFPLSGTEAGVVPRVDAILADVLDPLHRSGFCYVLRALEYGTAASRGRRFTDLGRREQLEVLETWCEPDVVPRRVAGESLKAVLGMAYFAHPEIKAAMGWRRGCEGGAV